MSDKLQKWIRQSADDRNLSCGEQLIAVLHRADLAEPLDAHVSMCEWFKNCKTRQVDFFEAFVSAEDISLKLEIDLSQLMTAVVEKCLSLSNEYIEELAGWLVALADELKSPSLRFLAAVSLLNIGNLEGCVEQCESVDKPYGPIHGLLGQALLEQGRPLEAIEALNVALALNSNDTLAMFQILKAYFCVEDFDSFWKWFDKAESVVGTHIELDYLAAVALLQTVPSCVSQTRLTHMLTKINYHAEQMSQPELTQVAQELKIKLDAL
jgi:tetratricopeptide (TPR) repeat protein